MKKNVPEEIQPHNKRRESNRDEQLIKELNELLDVVEDDINRELNSVSSDSSFDNKANFFKDKEQNPLLEAFNNSSLHPALIAPNIVGDRYKHLISKLAVDSSKKSGEFYTPPEISTLLARIVAPQSGDRIYDPCCGSGSLLIRVAKEVPDSNVALFGQEMNVRICALCRINMFLHGFDGAGIQVGDTIWNPKLINVDSLEKFNVVVANSLFSLYEWDEEKAQNDRWNRFLRGVPPKGRGDFAFILHMIASMTATDGRAGVVVPHGVLFRKGSEGTIRQKLIEENLLEGVIGLPANLLLGTGIPVALLFFNHAKKDKNVFFIDASKDFKKDRNQNRLREEDIEKIIQIWKECKSVAKYSHLASFSEIKKNDFNLNISLYVNTFREEEKIDVETLRGEISLLEEQLNQTRRELVQALEDFKNMDNK